MPGSIARQFPAHVERHHVGGQLHHDRRVDPDGAEPRRGREVAPPTFTGLLGDAEDARAALVRLVKRARDR
jgi:hypothetical protein